MKINSVFSDYNLFNVKENVAKDRDRTSKHVSDFYNKTVTDYVSISEEGKQALREKVHELSPESENITAYEVTTQNTNEIEWEHYMAMRELQMAPFKDKEYNVEDMMSSSADAYETLYNKIVEQHKDGNRQVTYDIAGESSVTLEEDLEGLNRAYEKSLSNLAGYITVQQTNKAFANPDSAWYFKRIGMQPSKENSQDNQDMEQKDYLDQEYINTAMSVMKQAREQFLLLFGNANYNKGAMKGIVFNMINGNADFMAKTQKLFS